MDYKRNGKWRRDIVKIEYGEAEGDNRGNEEEGERNGGRRMVNEEVRVEVEEDERQYMCRIWGYDVVEEIADKRCRERRFRGGECMYRI